MSRVVRVAFALLLVLAASAAPIAQGNRAAAPAIAVTALR